MPGTGPIVAILGTDTAALAADDEDSGESHNVHYHRQRFRDGDKERMRFTMSRTSVAALVLLCLAISGTIFLVGDVLYDSATAGAVGGAVFAWFVWFWFGLPLLRRATAPRGTSTAS